MNTNLNFFFRNNPKIALRLTKAKTINNNMNIMPNDNPIHNDFELPKKIRETIPKLSCIFVKNLNIT